MGERQKTNATDVSQDGCSDCYTQGVMRPIGTTLNLDSEAKEVSIDCKKELPLVGSGKGGFRQKVRAGKTKQD